MALLLRLLAFLYMAVVSILGFQPRLVTRHRQNLSRDTGFGKGVPQLLVSSGSNDSMSDANLSSTIASLKEAMQRIHILQAADESPTGGDGITMVNLLRKHSLRVGPSSIPGAGSGVFADKNIKAGTIICYYPVHGLGLERFDMHAIVAATHEDQNYFNDLQADEDDASTDEENNDESASKNHNYLHYLMGSRPLCGFQATENGAQLYIDVNPNSPIHKTWISHFINDGAIVESNSEQGLIDYYQSSTKRKNCVHIPFGPAPIMVTVTNCKVKKGEELFTTYGGSYWLDALVQQMEDDNDGTEVEPVDITDEVTMQARQTAKDVFDSMRSTRATYASLESELEKIFTVSL